MNMESKLCGMKKLSYGVFLVIAFAVAIPQMNSGFCQIISAGMVWFLVGMSIKSRLRLLEKNGDKDNNSDFKTKEIMGARNILRIGHCIFFILFKTFATPPTNYYLLVLSSGYHISNICDILNHNLQKTNDGAFFFLQSCSTLTLQTIVMNGYHVESFDLLVCPLILHWLLYSMQDFSQIFSFQPSKFTSCMLGIGSWLSLVVGQFGCGLYVLLNYFPQTAVVVCHSIEITIIFSSLQMICYKLGVLTYLQTQWLEKEVSTVKPTTFWIVYGQKYDLSAFAKTHPGGEVAIKLGEGRDCTALFSSYHPFSSKHLAVLSKYAVPDCDHNKTLESYSADEFYQTLKTRVQSYFYENKIDAKASLKRKIYYITVLLGFLVSYCYLYLEGIPGGAFMLAVFGWLCGSFGHDGSHFAISHNPTVNYLGSLGMGAITSPFIWLYQHTYSHHSFTNDFSHDPDLHHFDGILRIHSNSSWLKRYQFQSNRLYVYFWYIIVVFGSTIWIPVASFINQSLHGITDLRSVSREEWIKATSHTIIFVWLILIQPFFHLSKCQAALNGLLYLIISGLFFGFFSQVNHLDPESVSAAAKQRSKPSWAATQVETSNNFCTDSYFWTWLSNGLNHQIEHHLFPGINHEKLPLIRSIVQKTCEEFGVNYRSYPSTRSILQATANYYHLLSSPMYKMESSS